MNYKKNNKRANKNQRISFNQDYSLKKIDEKSFKNNKKTNQKLKKKTNNKTKEKTLSTWRNKKVKDKIVIEGGGII